MKQSDSIRLTALAAAVAALVGTAGECSADSSWQDVVQRAAAVSHTTVSLAHLPEALVLQPSDGALQVLQHVSHSSHRSHASHASHSSHRSHVSHYSGSF